MKESQPSPSLVLIFRNHAVDLPHLQFSSYAVKKAHYLNAKKVAQTLQENMYNLFCFFSSLAQHQRDNNYQCNL